MTAITITWDAPLAGPRSAARPVRRAVRAMSDLERPMLPTRADARERHGAGSTVRPVPVPVPVRMPVPMRAQARVPAAALRVTRRGRLLLGAVAAGLVLAGAFSAQTAVADGTRESVAVVTRTVAPGETLWSISGSLTQPGEDRRDVVDRLAALNGLPDSRLQAGQEILVPAP